MKDDANPVSVAEQGIAEFLRGLPALSGLFSGEKEIPVYAATDESATAIISARIKRALMQTVLVSFGGIATVSHPVSVFDPLAQQTVCDTTINIDVLCPGLLSAKALSSSADIAMAIVTALDGARFDAPFSAPLLFASWSQEDRDGVFVSALSFKTFLTIKE